MNVKRSYFSKYSILAILESCYLILAIQSLAMIKSGFASKFS